MRLRFDERKQLLKVTHPRGVRPAAALAWAATQKQWVEEQLGRMLPPQPLLPGAVIPVEGREVTLAWEEAFGRAAKLEEARLTCGGPESGFSRRIELFLRRHALEILSRETAEIAGRAAVHASAVSVGDARTRWGSCSSKGSIRYNWRLILAPPEARRYVVAHEVAHLKHLNHGRDFKALERALFGGDTGAAEALLREAGPRIRRIAAIR
jgi:predicted metal-dependent hydrolase